ncbi:TetR/AcrR family transcriptional regulator [Paenibacillus sanguinis]|uniref:TetR/AcrR family transcriptional regulator n=1 Tax=Paenibacillus sanguinis TaxID=225906 RepID=UPI00037C453E|nr:TetR-like C-terminal domain-containing protein [Paenibacillus sanguinis]
MNQRERLTKLLLKQSLIKLLRDRNISKISVKELCNSADINRSTFYLHYANVYELLSQVEKEIIDNTHEYLAKIEAHDHDIRYILAFLDYIKKNDELFTIMLFKTNEPVSFAQRLINEVLLNIDSYLQLSVPEKVKPYTYAYLVNGCLAIIQEWIRENYSLSSNEVAQLIFSLADHSLIAFSHIEGT